MKISFFLKKSKKNLSIMKVLQCERKIQCIDVIYNDILNIDSLFLIN
jgi:hypothetical protein